MINLAIPIIENIISLRKTIVIATYKADLSIGVDGPELSMRTAIDASDIHGHSAIRGDQENVLAIH